MLCEPSLAGLERSHTGELMKLRLHLSRGCRWRTAALVALPLTVRATAESACPNWVETPSGSSFNVAALISDNASPEAALAKVRAALAKINAGGVCNALGASVACIETVALGRKAEFRWKHAHPHIS